MVLLSRIRTILVFISLSFILLYYHFNHCNLQQFIQQKLRHLRCIKLKVFDDFNNDQVNLDGYGFYSKKVQLGLETRKILTN